MPKPLYGHKPKAKAVAAPPATSTWLTVDSALTDDDARHASVAAALAAALPDLPPPSLHPLAAVLSDVADPRNRPPNSLVDWLDALRNLIEELAISADGGGGGGVNDVEDDDDEVPRAIVAALRGKCVLVPRPPPPPPLAPGAACLAVLNEDDEWHAATVVDVPEPRGGGGGASCYLVGFDEFGGHTQLTAAARVIALDCVADDDSDGDEAEEKSGGCELCARKMRLTFHHLIPRDTHARYVGKRLPDGIEGEPTKHFLSHHGAWLCRLCHSFVHRFAPNSELAERYNSMERLRSHPDVLLWTRFAASQRVGLDSL